MHGQMSKSWSPDAKVLHYSILYAVSLQDHNLFYQKLHHSILVLYTIDSIYLVDILNSRLYMERIQGSTVKEILRVWRQGGKSFKVLMMTTHHFPN